MQNSVYFMIEKKQVPLHLKFCVEMWRHQYVHVMSFWPVKKCQMPTYLFVIKESTQKSASYDALIDSLAQSVGELRPKIASKATAATLVVFKGAQIGKS